MCRPEALTGELPYGDEATWESRRRLPLVHRGLPSRPFDGAGQVAALGALPDGWSDLLLACVNPDAAARPRPADIRHVLSGGALSRGTSVCSRPSAWAWLAR